MLCLRCQGGLITGSRLCTHSRTDHLYMGWVCTAVIGVTFRGNPCLACRVTHHTSSSSMNFSLWTPSGSSKKKLPIMTASTVRSSARARVWPMQFLGPVLKGFQLALMLRRLPLVVASGCAVAKGYDICCRPQVPALRCCLGTLAMSYRVKVASDAAVAMTIQQHCKSSCTAAAAAIVLRNPLQWSPCMPLSNPPKPTATAMGIPTDTVESQSRAVFRGALGQLPLSGCLCVMAAVMHWLRRQLEQILI